jgi:myo-inositol-1(or 4)-monophosphatase
VTGIAHKSSVTDPVTDADRGSEALIRELLREARPDDAIVGEEGDPETGDSGLRWVVDPLDGTVNFLYGIPLFCVSIACEDDAGALVAVVHDPLRDETFTASRGDGARLGERRLAVRPAVEPARALVATGFSYEEGRRVRQAAIAAQLLPRVRDIRRGGAAALDLAWLAAGRWDAFYEHGLQRWDRAAGELLVREAGGQVRALAAVDGLPEGLLAAPAGLLEALAELVAPPPG